ncbi:hypothetical protein tb265_31480 [Gemmatimonadetes bacterium T265]|nr:hypothetical protein tb265_31480 [Gemmatimonadetes bacterium T265]
MRTAILFELDGVLVDTRVPRTESLAAAFATESVAARPVLDVLDTSASFDDLARAVAAARARAGDVGAGALDDTALALVALRAEREYARRIAAGVTLVDGARALVEACAVGWRVGIVTGWHRVDAERVLALAGLDASVRFVVAADDGPAFASTTVRFARAVARLARPGMTDAARVLAVVGRSSVDAARAAGARAVRVGDHLPLRMLTPDRLAELIDRESSLGASSLVITSTPP